VNNQTPVVLVACLDNSADLVGIYSKRRNGANELSEGGCKGKK
jgi:hypothetical protein